MLLVDLENTLVFQKKGLDRSICILNFNCCPLVWHFTSMRSTNKIDSIQKRALRLLCNDYTNTYDSLLAKAKKPSMVKSEKNTKRFKSNVDAVPFLFTFIIHKTTK